MEETCRSLGLTDQLNLLNKPQASDKPCLKDKQTNACYLRNGNRSYLLASIITHTYAHTTPHRFTYRLTYIYIPLPYIYRMMVKPSKSLKQCKR